MLRGVAAVALTLVWSPFAAAQSFEPEIGQPGKDVVWVPTSPAMVEKMLDLAGLTPQDFVMDLGSGDGRNIIAAAKRGARGLGVEFNPDMVALSRRLAQEAGVADKASFVQGDMYEADISKATVLALFLLSTNLDTLKDKFLALAPGTRVVLNTFRVPGWEPDVTETLEDGCVNWCTALLHIVPARVAGSWRVGEHTLTLVQEFQRISGTMTVGGQDVALTGAHLNGADVSFSVNGSTYAGRVDGDRMSGTVRSPDGTSRSWTAVKVASR